MSATDSPVATSFMQARKYTRGPRTKGAIGLLVVHATAGREVAGGARGVAAWFADPNTRDASANYVVDDREVIQCVRESDIAWGAAHANARGLHIEHVGLSTQTPQQWVDAYSSPETALSVRLAADICKRNSIPPVWLLPGDLLAGRRGITSHMNVEAAWPSTGHSDPGAGFPARWYVAQVKALISGVPAPKPPLTLWQVGIDILQPTGPDSALHLSPVQLDDLRNRYTVTIVPHARPRVVT